MEERKQDLRIIKTEKSIKQAMISLLYVTSYDKITVTDIVKKAMVNRNTFYLHYIDKGDLLEHIIEDDYIRHKGMLNSVLLVNYDDAKYPEEYAYSVLKKVFDEVSKVRFFYEKIVNNESTKIHLLKIFDRFKINLINKYSNNNKKKIISLEYTFSALTGTFFTWLSKGNDLGSIEEISRTLSKMLVSSIEKIKTI